MAEFERSQVQALIRRFDEPPHRLIALFGPRQSGKTTIVRQTLRRINVPHIYLAVDEPETSDFRITTALGPSTFREAPRRDSDWLVRHWQEARLQAERAPNGFVLVLDEIQKLDGWSETVKGLWDADRARRLPMHVVILGSAPLLMQRGLSDSLAGRFETIRIPHWSFYEMAQAFEYDLPQYLYFGGYPGASGLVSDQERWRDYILAALIETNIERDLLSMTRVDKPALLKQLFELATAYSGQILSFNKMLGQLTDAGNTTTLARYLELLESAGLLVGLQQYANQPVRSRASSPKLNVLNTALMTAGSGYSFEEAQADRSYWGRIVESAAGAHLLNTASSDIRVHYWRQSPLEVDFVLQKGRRLLAFEIKSGPSDGDQRGLHEFRERYQAEGTYVVGPEGIPLNEFLTFPAQHWFEES